MPLPEHLQKVVDSPRAQKIYKQAQYKEGVKHFGKIHTIKAMKNAYSPKSKALSEAKKIGGTGAKGIKKAINVALRD